jgi:DNA-binding NarL/FixJ family response regulator
LACLGVAGETLSDIAAQLPLSLSTVSTYRARIMEKIETHNDVETALYAVRHHLVSMAS